MKIGDLVRIKDAGTVALVVRVIDGDHPWIYLHTGGCFWAEKLEVINENR